MSEVLKSRTDESLKSSLDACEGILACLRERYELIGNDIVRVAEIRRELNDELARRALERDGCANGIA